jgi:predicted transport protein
MLIKKKSGVTGLPYIGFTAEKNLVCICMQRKIYYFSFVGWMKCIYIASMERNGCLRL